MAISVHETKTLRVVRKILSFLLAIDIAIVGLACCLVSSFMNDRKIEKCVTSYAYTSGVRETFLKYAESEYLRNGLGTENLENIISFTAVNKVVEGYAGYYISSRVGFEETTYRNAIILICNKIKNDMAEQIKLTGQSYDERTVRADVRGISDYFDNEIKLHGIERLETLLNLGTSVGYGMFGVSMFFFVAIGLVLLFLGNKRRRYRSLGAMGVSFFTAGIFEIFLSVMAIIISDFRKIDIYPVYLHDSFMHYFYSCAMTVATAGLLLMLISFLVSASAWVYKVRGKR